MSDQSADYSVDAMLKVLDTWGTKGHLKKSTADNLRGVCERVLGILDQGKQSDVRDLDIDDAITRFHNLNPGVSSASLRVYKSRISKAINLFASYRDDPIHWKPDIQPRSRRNKDSSNTEQRKSSKKSKTTEEAGPPHKSFESLSSLTIPFPLRADVTINIAGIPRDLTVKEAERIAAFLKPLAVDFGRGED